MPRGRPASVESAGASSRSGWAAPAGKFATREHAACSYSPSTPCRNPPDFVCCRHLAKLHGASAFTFLSDNTLQTETSHAPKPRVLIVDDNPDAADTLATLLDIYYWPSHVAYSGVEAIAMGDLIRPHLVILDISMPHMDGFETARKMRERPWGEQLSIAALTGWGDEHTRGCIAEAGMNYHLTKPVTIDALLGVLAKIRA